MRALWRALAGLVLLMRPWDWARNLLLLAPVVFSAQSFDIALAQRVGLALALFCAASSALYCLNDVMDRRLDALHPVKRARPLPSRAVGVAAALVLAVALAGTALYFAWTFDRPFFRVLALYLALGALYSLSLRRLGVLDVLAVAILYVLRINAGAALMGAQPSVWMVIIAFLFGIFAALARRRDDVMAALERGGESGRPGYNEGFLNVAVSVFLTVLVISYVMYVTDPTIAERTRIDRLHFTVPFVVAGALRYLQVILVDEKPGEPFRLLWRDPLTLALALGFVGTLVALFHV
ncbi:MAG: UbiA prenyltransferase family protein [Reyranellaceae bacterium]